ncbi:MAG: hotdog fold thioesterase [Lentisphaeria bacterium]|nr:hotdog fold thioesterase [Lentisphaeria bacterium]
MGSLDFPALKKLFRNDRFAEFIGAEVVAGGGGMGKARLEIHTHHLNGLGIVQGGAVFTLADLAFAVACNSHGNKAVGLNASINWLRPGLTGVLQAEAREVSCTRRIATYEVLVTDDAGELLATFHGTAYRKDEQWDLN